MDKLDQIFAQQFELTERFSVIEQMNGFPHLQAYGELESFKAQARLRDSAWRITEEIGEAREATEEHQVEELIDVLHFLVEFAILIGCRVQDLQIASFGKTDALESLMYDSSKRQLTLNLNLDILQFILYKAIHELKNKPWKQSMRTTDLPTFHHYVRHLFAQMGRTFRDMDMTADDVHAAYFGKAKENQWRMDSGA